MNLHDDPRLTAWALGEGDEAERAGVQALLAADPAARDAVEAIRASAAELGDALASGPLPVLDAAHRAALEAALAEPAAPAPAPAPVLPLRGMRPWMGHAAAAALIVAGLALAMGDGGVVHVVPFEVAAGDGQGSPPRRAGVPVSRDGFLDDVTNGLEDGRRSRGPSGEAATRVSIQYGFDVEEPGTGTGSAGGGGGAVGNLDHRGADRNWTKSAGSGGGAGGALLVKGAGSITGSERKEPAGNAASRLNEALEREQSSRVSLLGVLSGGEVTTSVVTVRIPGYAGPAGEIPADSRSPGDPPPPDGGGGTSVVLIGERLHVVGRNGVVSTVPLVDGKNVVLLDPAGRPLAEGFFNNLSDGDFRARTENLLRESTTEAYGVIVENEFLRPEGEQALSTFSIDVDTASYAILRRFLVQDGRLPPKGAVRIEEMVNYFPYDYAPPADGRPFAVHVDAAAAPWNPRHRLVRIAMKGREVSVDTRPAANLVFLLDVSGSMKPANKLPLVKQSIAMLVEELQARDRVAIVVYAGASGMVLPSTTGDHRAEILAALDRLNAGGSTNGGSGIELAYKVAAEHFIPGGVNRVILATDGDFNVGVTNNSDLTDLIAEKAKTKVFLTALGFGMGNLKDSTLETLADRGNGNYGYIDGLSEARKVLVEEGMGTLVAIAKDVKIQVDFNPARVAAYRLLGYENRLLAAQDFNDDAKDAGEVGAGHTVTALYEIVPVGEPIPAAAVEGSKYVEPASPPRGGTPGGGTVGADSPESLTVRLRYKEPEGDASTRFDVPFVDGGRGFDAAPEGFRFAASVALFGMVLHGSKHCGDATYDAVREIASGALGEDARGHRHEFLTLVDRAAGMK